MSEEDRAYYERRAEQERQAAAEAVDEASAMIHLALAERYSLLTRSLVPGDRLAADFAMPVEAHSEAAFDNSGGRGGGSAAGSHRPWRGPASR